jgi:hypothetical protein
VNPYRWSLLGLVSTVVLMLLVTVDFWPLLLLDAAWIVRDVYYDRRVKS